MRLKGKVIEGYKIASGYSTSGRYPDSTIKLQTPHFLKRGVDISDFYPGTLNISIAPRTFEILQPTYVLKDVDWIPSHQPETFMFCKCEVTFQNQKCEGLIYYPSPETKEIHFQSPSTIEVLAPHIPGLSYGDEIELILSPDQIRIT